MARSRNIKPGFFRNADLADLPMEARMLFIGLWVIADREGRLEDRPKQIKMEVFPADNLDCDGLLQALAETGMVIRYQVDGKRYLQVTNFSKHQNPHKEEKQSSIPAPDMSDACTVQTSGKTDASTRGIGLIPDSLLLIPDSLLLIPDSLLLIPDSLIPATDAPSDGPASGERDDPQGFKECWSIYPKREGGNSRASAVKAYRARLKAGASPADLLAGVKRYAAYSAAKGNIGTSYIKQAASFFGPDKHWLEPWEFQPEPSPTNDAKQDAAKKPQPGDTRTRYGATERFDECMGWVPA